MIRNLWELLLTNTANKLNTIMQLKGNLNNPTPFLSYSISPQISIARANPR